MLCSSAITCSSSGHMSVMFGMRLSSTEASALFIFFLASSVLKVSLNPPPASSR